jgi:hypothetical protein
MTSPTSELGLDSLAAECRFVEEQHRDTPLRRVTPGGSRALWKPRLGDEHDVYAWCTSTEARATPLLAARSGHTSPPPRDACRPATRTTRRPNGSPGRASVLPVPTSLSIRPRTEQLPIEPPYTASRDRCPVAPQTALPGVGSAFMPDTTLLHLLTGHTVRTTSTVQAALDALKPAALAGPRTGQARRRARSRRVPPAGANDPRPIRVDEPVTAELSRRGHRHLRATARTGSPSGRQRSASRPRRVSSSGWGCPGRPSVRL